MNHADVRARMADYLEGHLELTDRALLDAHLDACPECSADIAEMRAMIGLLRTLPEPQVPGDFSANVMRRIRTGESAPSFFDRVSGFFADAFSPRFLAPASAALLSAGFVLWGQQVGFFEPGGVRAPAAEQSPAAIAQTGSPVAPSEAIPGPTRGATQPGVQLAGLGAAPAGTTSSSFGVEQVSGESGQGPLVHVTISFLAAPPPYQIEHSRSAPVPFRSEWGGAPMQSVAVASTPTGVVGPHDATLRRAATPPAGARYGVGPDATQGEPRSRDDWLAILEGSPAEFAEQLSLLTLAEQELWVDRLARHAAEQGSLDRVVERLRAAGGDVGQILADDFAAVGSAASQ